MTTENSSSPSSSSSSAAARSDVCCTKRKTSGCGLCKVAFLSAILVAGSSEASHGLGGIEHNHHHRLADVLGHGLNDEHSHHLRALQTVSDGGENATDFDTHDDEDGEHHDDEDGEHHDDEDGEHHGEESHNEHDHGNKPWGEVILASILINLASLIGLIFVAAGLASKALCGGVSDSFSPGFITHNVIPSFACGALLATCVFLILPEAFFLFVADAEGSDGHDSHSEEEGVDEDHSDHDHRFLEEDAHDHGDDIDSEVAWKMGAAIIGGFLLPLLFSMIFSSEEQHVPDTCAECHESGTSGKDEPDADSHESEANVSNPARPAPVSKKSINYSLASSILLGDFFHNFTDGVFVGTAFLLCDRSIAITIAAATVYHELAQEVADFYLLTKHCNIRVWVALVLNFIGGLSVLMGALIILSIDDITPGATGAILAVGGGVYLYIAVGECLPRARQAQVSMFDKLWSIISFIGGVLPIGLVLLNHNHCDG